MKLFMVIFRMICFLYGSQTLYYDIINSLAQSAYEEIGVKAATPMQKRTMQFNQNKSLQSNEPFKIDQSGDKNTNNPTNQTNPPLLNNNFVKLQRLSPE